MIPGWQQRIDSEIVPIRPLWAEQSLMNGAQKGESKVLTIVARAASLVTNSRITVASTQLSVLLSGISFSLFYPGLVVISLLGGFYSDKNSHGWIRNVEAQNPQCSMDFLPFLMVIDSHSSFIFHIFSSCSIYDSE